MKKKVACILVIFMLGFVLSSFTGKTKIIRATPFTNEIPDRSPFEGTKLLEDMKKEGYRFEWILMQEKPKMRLYLEELNYLLKDLATEKIIFNNLTPPFSISQLKCIPQEKLILISWEPPSVFDHQYKEEILSLFGTVLTWHDEMVDGKKFIKFHYPVLRPFENNLPPFKERKLLCMINSNLKFNDFEKELYSMRREAVQFFEKEPEGTFDLYGRGWEGYKNAKGLVPNKQETLKGYKFNFCFENAAIPGYITEKIFDSFATGTIPVYLGATNIEAYIPKECFIDYRQFENFEEMLTFIQHITEEEYDSYLSHIKAYLTSPESHLFSWEAFENILSEALHQ